MLLRGPPKPLYIADAPKGPTQAINIATVTFLVLCCWAKPLPAVTHCSADRNSTSAVYNKTNCAF